MSYLPNDITQDVTVDKNHLQSNFAALDNAISGNLTELNLSSASRIPNAQLASPNVEEIITLRWGATTGTAMVASATNPIDAIPLPGTGTYTILRASYTYFSTGAAGTAGSISVNLGTCAAGSFTSSSTLIASTALTNVTAGGQVITGNLTVSSPTFTAATTPTQLAIICTVSSVTTTPRLVVTLVVTRSLQ